jgi:hypothetical protein
MLLSQITVENNIAPQPERSLKTATDALIKKPDFDFMLNKKRDRAKKISADAGTAGIDISQ